ncbi:MAG: efflux RND transporter permease subunit [Gammaproteobacteria bacterium]|nr:efflux RND transporter permease subunit [Gammaproteobacteria bacterium]
METKLGLSGRIANTFLTSEITPLFALLGILLGVFAVIVTPKEEEPQINVTFANVLVAFPGASSKEVEQLVSTPAEQVLSEIQGVKHVYSISLPGRSVLTVQFKVGEDRTRSIVRLYNAIYSNQDWLPKNLGVAQPIIKPMGIDDVPIVTLTLWSPQSNFPLNKVQQITAYDLQKIAHTLEVELKRIKGTRDIYTIGGVDHIVHVIPNIAKLSSYRITLTELRNALQAANQANNTTEIVKDNREIKLQLGQYFSNAEDLASLIIAVHNEAPVYLRDVADVTLGPDQPEEYVSFGTGPGAANTSLGTHSQHPAVTIAIAKKAGTNAVNIADQIIQRLDSLKGTFIPDGVNVTITRNYGKTAKDKADKLISKLAFATASVVLLVLFTLGVREAIIVGVAVIITLTITLFASWAWGFTINRVSLFALIFSIGILVDDAIVVVENIHRHMQLNERPLLQAIPLAVNEVGGPTILATFTVIAALLPMAFVTGLMGPYMSPIPINASLGMLISLAVAFIVTPWMAYKFFRHTTIHSSPSPQNETILYRAFNRSMTPLLNAERGKLKRWLLLGGILLLMFISVLLPVFKAVVLKMLPFDNKSEIQVVVDMPEGSSVEQTTRVLHELATYIKTVPEVTDYQTYSGTASPINFNGLVRQYYLRQSANVGDIQINLVEKSQRTRKSHEIALAIRGPLQEIGKRFDANVKIVEIPPGPPVQSPIVAEIYGLDYAGQRRVAKELRAVFDNTADIADVDDSVEADAEKLIINIDTNKATLRGVSRSMIIDTLAMALSGNDISYLHGDSVKYPTPIRIEVSNADKADIENLLKLRVRSQRGHLVPLADVVTVSTSEREYAIYHKNLLPFTFVTGDLVGDLDSPVYGMFDIYNKLKDINVDHHYQLEQLLTSQPDAPYRYSIKWDGEWQITYETFRDMGIAYAVGIILIYLLVVAQFRSYITPLIIMVPIPLTIIGVMPGHALWGSQFTATSMIGMIALAGIIVRNSILLVDFIHAQLKQGVALQEAVIRAGAVRAKPIILTGLAAMLGALFILDDPIFNGLAISLIFGVFISTLLTLFVIPVLYYSINYKKHAAA